MFGILDLKKRGKRSMGPVSRSSSCLRIRSSTTCPDLLDVRVLTNHFSVASLSAFPLLGRRSSTCRSPSFASAAYPDYRLSSRHLAGRSSLLGVVSIRTDWRHSSDGRRANGSLTSTSQDWPRGRNFSTTNGGAMRNRQYVDTGRGTDLC